MVGEDAVGLLVGEEEGVCDDVRGEECGCETVLVLVVGGEGRGLLVVEEVVVTG